MKRPVIEPRILQRKEAAIYVGFRAAATAFDGWAKRLSVRPVRCGVRGASVAYDRRDLDAAIDREKGIAPASPDGEIEW